MSRTPARPQTVFTDQVVINLPPGETKTVTLDTHTAVKAGHMISFALAPVAKPAADPSAKPVAVAGVYFDGFMVPGEPKNDGVKRFAAPATQPAGNTTAAVATR